MNLGYCDQVGWDLKINISDSGAEEEEVQNSRVANRLLKLTRDLAVVKNKGIINLEIAGECWFLGVSTTGVWMNWIRKYDNSHWTYNGGPAGLNSIAVCW
jgi:Holliday junction resolvasome RuvABC ATP-dependent DNA helicase subunit